MSRDKGSEVVQKNALLRQLSPNRGFLWITPAATYVVASLGDMIKRYHTL